MVKVAETRITGRGRMPEPARKEIMRLEREAALLKEELERKSRLVDNLYRALPISVLVVKRNLEIAYANPHFLTVSHKRERAVIGSRLETVFASLLPQDHMVTLAREMKEAFKSGRPYEGRLMEYGRRFYLSRIWPLDQEKDRVSSVLLIEDITEKAKMEQELERFVEELKRTKDYLENILLSAADAIFSTNPQGEIITWNKACEEQFGYSALEMQGRNARLLISPEHPADSLDQPGLETLEKGSWEGEIAYRRKDGSLFVGWTRIKTLRGEGGQPMGYLSICRDITERVRLERELRRVYAEVVEANRKLEQSMQELKEAQDRLIQAEKLSALGTLISGIGHELNNPLAGVIGYSQLILESPGDDQNKDMLKKINSEAMRCRRIVENLLTFAHRHKSRKDLVNLNEIVESTLELVAYQLRTDNILVEKELASDLPRTMADFNQMGQVFLNLINNAYQSMVQVNRPRRLRIRTETDGHLVRAIFSDTGAGIPKEHLKRIFDPFFTTKEPGQGTGLGLTISYGIVKEHDGEIIVRSEWGKGATVAVELPVSRVALPPTDSAPVASSPEITGGREILVVDDEKTVAELMTRILRLDGHGVDTVGTGGEAIAHLKEKEYDLILLDLKLPGMSGQEIYERVKVERPHLASRVVFCSGVVASQEVEDFIMATGNPLINKPFMIAEFRETIKTLLASHGKDPGGR